MLFRDVSHGKISSEAKKPQCHGYMYVGNNNMMVHGIEGGKKEAFVMIVTVIIHTGTCCDITCECTPQVSVQLNKKTADTMINSTLYD